MKILKAISTLFAAALIFAGCNADQTQVANTAPDSKPTVEVAGYIADDFDLQRVGNLLERSKSPEEFEAYLNGDNGINNLDLNGDGYVDYVSVEEFGGPSDRERGLSLYTRFSPDRTQDLGTIYFYRDEPRYPGARVVVVGNDNIYGDNSYYETNWLEKTLNIVTSLFAPRRTVYRSPYYVNNYPPTYTAYEVVQAPVYRTRIERLYPQPILIFTNAAPVYFSQIKIKSPNFGRHLNEIFGKPKKPTKEQETFIAANPRKPERGDKPGSDKQPPSQDKKDHPDKGEKPEGGPPGPPKADKPGKPEQGDKGKPKGKGKPDKP